jgi:hypothetical protein
MIPNVMFQHLKNDKKSIITVHFKGEASFYKISNSYIYIGGEGYNYNERVPWCVLTNTHGYGP